MSAMRFRAVCGVPGRNLRPAERTESASVGFTVATVELFRPGRCVSSVKRQETPAKRCGRSGIFLSLSFFLEKFYCCDLCGCYLGRRVLLAVDNGNDDLARP